MNYFLFLAVFSRRDSLPEFWLFSENKTIRGKPRTLEDIVVVCMCILRPLIHEANAVIVKGTSITH